MVLPVGSTVRLQLETTDVNHSFWVLKLLVKRDLIRGTDNEIDADATEAGEWVWLAEFCGGTCQAI